MENYTAEPTPCVNYTAEPTPCVKINLRSLPPGLRESLKPYPEKFWLPLLTGQMPALMALADGVTVRYCDGKLQQLGGMAIIIAEQAGNKSTVKDVVDQWLAQVQREDELVLQREDKVRDYNRQRKANERAQPQPEGVVRIVPVNISCAKLLRRLKNSQGHTLYSFAEEVDSLIKGNSGGTWAQKFDTYRLSFDSGRIGNDVLSEQSESGSATVRYNWTILGTYGAVRKMFSGKNESNVENGLSSRMMIAEMPDNLFAKMTVFRELSAADKQVIERSAAMLRAASGFYDTPRLRKAIGEWVEQKRVEAAQSVDKVMDTYRKRAAVIGFRCGVVYMLLCGKETNGCLEFARMMAEATLTAQLRTFGPLLRRQYAQEAAYSPRTSVNENVLAKLPPVFTFDNLRLEKGGEFTDSALYSIISRWKSDGWIEKTGKGCWRKL